MSFTISHLPVYLQEQATHNIMIQTAAIARTGKMITKQFARTIHACKWRYTTKSHCF